MIAIFDNTETNNSILIKNIKLLTTRPPVYKT